MARNSMGCRQRKDGRYELRFTVDGKTYSVYGKTPKECKNKELERREEIRSVLYTNNRNLTMEKFFEEWIKAREGVVKGSTILLNKTLWNKHIKPAFGRKKIINIEKREIVAFQKKLVETLKPSTIQEVMIELKSILNEAVNNDIILKSPAAGVKPLAGDGERATETIHRALTVQEQKIFLQALKSEWQYEIIAFLLCSGVRTGEAGALLWSDIDYTNNVIHITKTVTRDENSKRVIGKPKTKSSVRDIPMNDIIKEILKSQKEKQKMLHGNIINLSQPVFETISGGLIYTGDINRTIQRVLGELEKLGKHIDYFSAHAMRDTFATRYIENGGTAQTLKTILGHSSLEMTMDLYSHVLPNTKQDEMNKIITGFKAI